jgi:hypothetical protein
VGMVVSELWSSAGVAVPRGKRPGRTGMARPVSGLGNLGSAGNSNVAGWNGRSRV